jgi:hypothetical protein
MDRYDRTDNADRNVRPENSSDNSLLPVERVDQLRRWIASGGPHQPEVIDAIARRMLERGDLYD